VVNKHRKKLERRYINGGRRRAWIFCRGAGSEGRIGGLVNHHHNPQTVRTKVSLTIQKEDRKAELK